MSPIPVWLFYLFCVLFKSRERSATCRTTKRKIVLLIDDEASKRPNNVIGKHLFSQSLPFEEAANESRVRGADGSALADSHVSLVVVDPGRQHQPCDRQRA